MLKFIKQLILNRRRKMFIRKYVGQHGVIMGVDVAYNGSDEKIKKGTAVYIKDGKFYPCK